MKSETTEILPSLSQGPLSGVALRRIAIVRALPGLGDLLCLVPALRTLRAALPQTRITLVGLPWAHEFVARFSHYLDNLLEFPGYPGIPERPLNPENFPAFLIQAHQLRLDLALQMHGNGSLINPFTILLNARRTAGFYRAEDYCPDTRYFLPYPSQEPEIWRHLRLLEFLGFPLQGVALEFPLHAEDWQALRNIPAAQNLPEQAYVCIHPGARDPTRRWPPERFAVVADRLATLGLEIVLTGTPEEAPLARAVIGAMHVPARNLCGSTSLGALAALLSGARLAVCNDTGISHLAAALRVPSVVIFSYPPSVEPEPNRWAPLDKVRHRAIYPLETPETVQKTTHSQIRSESDLSTPWVPPETVISEIKDLLNYA